ncbi:hypothetical protein ON010_g15438 [Phytophthora cinnamomi]|nr:hypothetical protein ON010_g15438 [Phytophthora cinnamomi]
MEKQVLFMAAKMATLFMARTAMVVMTPETVILDLLLCLENSSQKREKRINQGATDGSRPVDDLSCARPLASGGLDPLSIDCKDF